MKTLPAGIETAYEMVGQKTEQENPVEAECFANMIPRNTKNLRIIDIGAVMEL